MVIPNPTSGGGPIAGEVARDGKAWVYAVDVASSELYLVDGLR